MSRKNISESPKTGHPISSETRKKMSDSLVEAWRNPSQRRIDGIENSRKKKSDSITNYFLEHPDERAVRTSSANAATRKYALMRMCEVFKGNDPKEYLQTRLNDSGLSKTEIASQLGISYDTLLVWAYRLGIENRRRGKYDSTARRVVESALESGKIHELSSVDQQLLIRRFMIGEPLSVVGAAVSGISRERVRQRANKALEKLR